MWYNNGMIKECQRCKSPIDVKGNFRFCPPCGEEQRKLIKRQAASREPKEKNNARSARFREKHREQIRLNNQAINATPEHKRYIAQYHSVKHFGGLREAVLKRDDYKCQMCRQTPQGFRPVIVHHLDHDCTHNTMENLATLCRSCHPVAHGPWSQERRLEHSERMKAIGTGGWNKGLKTPETVRAKISQANKGRRQSPEAIEHMREAKRLWWVKRKSLL